MAENDLYGTRSGYIDLKSETIQLVKRGEICRAVILSLWTVEDDLTDNPKPEYAPPPNGGGNSAIVESKQNLYLAFYGFGGAAVHEIKAGQTTNLIYCKNAADLYVRGINDKITRLYYSIFN